MRMNITMACDFLEEAARTDDVMQLTHRMKSIRGQRPIIRSKKPEYDSEHGCLPLVAQIETGELAIFATGFEFKSTATVGL